MPSPFESNILQSLRLQNIFGPENAIGGQAESPPMNPALFQTPTAAGPPPMETGLYQPEAEYMNRVGEMVRQLPTRDKPGFLRTLLGGIAAVGLENPEFGYRVANAPYYKGLEEWKAKFGPYEELAKMEQTRNVNERQLMLGILADQIRQQRADTYERSVATREEESRARTDLARKKIELMDFKSKNPNLTFKTGEDGYIYGLHPQTGKAIRTEVKSGDLNDIDRMNLGLDMALTKIGAAGEEARETARVREDLARGRVEAGKWTIVNITDEETGKQKSVRLNTVTGETQPISGKVTRPGVERTGGVEGEESATQTKVKQYNRAREALNTHPEWNKFITLGAPGTNDFKVKPPARGFLSSGPTPEIHKAINEFIYGKSKRVETGRIRVRAPNGQTGSWPANKPLPKGYTRIGTE